MAIVESPPLSFHTGIGINSAALLFVGGVCSMKNIAKGDVLLGDDMKPRIIIDLECKEADAVIVTPELVESFTIGKEHKLTLYSDSTGQTVDIKVSDFLQKSQAWKDKFKLFYLPLDFPAVGVHNDPYLIGMLLNIKADRKQKMPKEELTEFAVKHYLDMRLKNLESYMTGMNTDMKMFLNGTCDKTELNKIIHDSSEHLFIPENYMYNSREIRHRLLRGFLEANKNADEWFRSRSKSPGRNASKTPTSGRSNRSNSAGGRPQPNSGRSGGSAKSNRSNRSNSADPPERKIAPPANKKGLAQFAKLNGSEENSDEEPEIVGKKYNDTLKLTKKEPRSRLSKFQSKIPKLGQSISISITDQFFAEQFKFLVRSLGFKCVYSKSELTIFDSVAKLRPANEKITMDFSVIPTGKTFLCNVKSNDGERFILSNGIIIHK